MCNIRNKHTLHLQHITNNFAIGFGGDLGRVEDIEFRSGAAEAGKTGSLPFAEGWISCLRGEMCFCLLLVLLPFVGGSDVLEDDAIGRAAG